MMCKLTWTQGFVHAFRGHTMDMDGISWLGRMDIFADAAQRPQWKPDSFFRRFAQ